MEAFMQKPGQENKENKCLMHRFEFGFKLPEILYKLGLQGPRHCTDDITHCSLHLYADLLLVLVTDLLLQLPVKTTFRSRRHLGQDDI